MSGATGFVGTALVRRMAADQRHSVRVATRRATGPASPGIETVLVGELSPATRWDEAMHGIDVVVALAARVHSMGETGPDHLEAYRRVNVEGTLHLARRAAANGVRRLVFLSSVKVNGESGRFVESDPAAARDAYGISKAEAEAGLRQLATQTGMEVVIIRSPLVYGPGVRANFGALMRAVGRGVPLPIGAVNNRRSLVAVDNLVDLIVTCVEHAAAANQTFMVSDGEDLSTPELVRRLARAMSRPARLFSVPPALLLRGATLLGKGAAAQRLLGSLVVDISKARTLLNWTPPVSVDEGLRRAAGSPG